MVFVQKSNDSGNPFVIVHNAYLAIPSPAIPPDSCGDLSLYLRVVNRSDCIRQILHEKKDALARSSHGVVRCQRFLLRFAGSGADDRNPGFKHERYSVADPAYALGGRGLQNTRTISGNGIAEHSYGTSTAQAISQLPLHTGSSGLFQAVSGTLSRRGGGFSEVGWGGSAADCGRDERHAG